MDELFDRDAESEAEEVESYFETSERLMSGGCLEEDLALWEEAAERFPGSFQVLHSLAHALWRSLPYTDAPSDADRKNAERVIDICLRILDDCTDNDIRNGAIQLLAYTYGREGYPCADEELAVKYANMAGTLYACREELLENAYFTAENRHKAKEQRHKNTLSYIDLAAINIFNDEYDTPEEVIFACETAIKLWDTLFYDGNYLDHNADIAYVKMLLAEQYAIIGDREKTLSSLREALGHAKAYDGIMPGRHAYTSAFLSSASCETPDGAGGELSFWLSEIRENDAFLFLHGDAEYEELING